MSCGKARGGVEKGIGKFIFQPLLKKKQNRMIRVFISVILFLLIAILITDSSLADEQKSDETINPVIGNVQPDGAARIVAQASQPPQAEPLKAPETPSASESSGKWISDGKDLGKWWIGRAKKQPKIPPELLYHLELDYSYSHDTGTEDEEQHKISSNLWLRKNIVTSVTMFKWKDKLTNRMNSLSGRRKLEFNEFLYAELWDWIDLAGGVVWMRDSRRYFDNRYLGLGGLYFTFFESPKFVLKAGAYYGYMETHYMQDALIESRLYPEPKFMRLPFDDYTTDVLYFAQRMSLKLTDAITFSESAGYRYELEDTDFYHWSVKFDLNFKLTTHFSLFASYEIDYDSNQIDKARSELLSTIGAEIEKRETEFSTGFRINF